MADGLTNLANKPVPIGNAGACGFIEEGLPTKLTSPGVGLF
jgi:hypothetical protein